MKTQDDFTADRKLGLLLVGEPWTGKSTLMMQFPNIWVCDADNNLSRIADRLKGKTFFYDRIDVDDNGNVIKEADQWKRVLAVTQKAFDDPRVKYLGFDTLGRIGHVLERYIVTQTTGGKDKGDLLVGGEKMMTQMHWNPFKTLMLRFVTEIRASNKPCVFVMHQKVDKDEVLGTLNYKPMIGGQLADNIGGLFTDVWHCTAEAGMPTKDNPSGTNYYVETVPQPRMAQLGTSLGLPPRFKVEWKTIADKLGREAV